MKRTIFEPDHDLFRKSVREFVKREISPNVPRWEAAGIVDKEAFRQAGRAEMLGMAIPESFGGGGAGDFRFNAVIAEELMSGDAMGSGLCITLHNDVVLPYFLELGTDEQRERWLPGMASGTLMGAIAMTGTGSRFRPCGDQNDCDPRR